MLVDADHLGRVGHKAVGQLRQVHQTVLLDAHVHETAEVRDVRHDARQLHPFVQVGQRMHIRSEGKHPDCLPQVASRLVQLRHDVGQGRHAHSVRHIAAQVDLPAQVFAGYQLVHRAVQVGGHALHQRVAFRMHRRVVQRIVAVGNTQETSTLLESLRSHPGHLQEVAPRGKRSVLGTIVHNVPGQLGPQAGDVGQQVPAGRVHIHADQIHTAFHRLVQRLLQGSLIDIVLILPHPDGLRVNLHQLGQRVHQAATDGHSPAHRHVIFRKLLAGHLRGRIDRSPVLAHRKGLHRARELQPCHEILRLASGRAVAYGYGLYGILFHQRRQLACRLRPFVARRMGIDGLVMQQIALRVQTHHLAPRAIAGVDGQHTLLSQRRSQQQLPQVGRKHTDGLLVGTPFALGGKLGFNGGFQQPLAGIVHRQAHLLAASVLPTHIPAFNPPAGLLVIRRNRHPQESLRLPATNGQQPV